MIQHASFHVVCKYFIVQYCTKSVISLEANVFFLIPILEQDVQETFSSLKLNTFMFSAKVLHQYIEIIWKSWRVFSAKTSLKFSSCPILKSFSPFSQCSHFSELFFGFFIKTFTDTRTGTYFTAFYSIALANQLAKALVYLTWWRLHEAAICNAGECCWSVRSTGCGRLLRSCLWSDLHEFLSPLDSPLTQNFSNPRYQFGFCTELISTGAPHAIKLGFAPTVYPPGQYK